MLVYTAFPSTPTYCVECPAYPAAVTQEATRHRLPRADLEVGSARRCGQESQDGRARRRTRIHVARPSEGLAYARVGASAAFPCNVMLWMDVRGSCLFVCLSVCLSVSQSVCLFLCLSVSWLSLSVCVSCPVCPRCVTVRLGVSLRLAIWSSMVRGQTLSISTAAGALRSFGRDSYRSNGSRVIDRFFLGAPEMTTFDVAGVGPRGAKGRLPAVGRFTRPCAAVNCRCGSCVQCLCT